MLRPNFERIWCLFCATIWIMSDDLLVENTVEASAITSLQFVRIGADGETLANGSLIAEIQDASGGTSNGRPFTSSSCAAVCAKNASCAAYSVAITAGGKSSCKIAADSTARVPMIGSRVYKKVMRTQLEGQGCTVSAECLGYPLMTCMDMACQCPVMSHVASLNLSSCLPVKNVGDACQEQVQCPSDCLNGTCTCTNAIAEALALIPGRNDTKCIDANMTQIDVSASLPYNLSYPFPRNSNYANNLNIFWCIEADPGAAGLTATVTFWDVERWYDKVHIQSNCTSQRTWIHSFWTNFSSHWIYPPALTTTTGNHIGVQFTSDSSVNMTGFTITFSAP